jgi:hypothetical protein
MISIGNGVAKSELLATVSEAVVIEVCDFLTTLAGSYLRSAVD